MRTLTLVRHAKSSWADPGLSDRERPLNKRGERDAPRMGQRIATAGIRPSLIVSSPALRAWTTARIIAAEIGYPLEFLQREKDLYLASLNRLLHVTAAQESEFQSLLLVGHNPGLTDFANFLVPGITDNLPTTGVLSVSFESGDWRINGRPECRDIIYDFPKNRAHA